MKWASTNAFKHSASTKHCTVLSVPPSLWNIYIHTWSSSLPEEDAATTGQGNNPDISPLSILCPDWSLEDAKTLLINSCAIWIPVLLVHLRPGHYKATDGIMGKEAPSTPDEKSSGSCPVQNTLKKSKLSHLDSAKDEMCVKPEQPPGTTVLSLHRIRT